MSFFAWLPQVTSADYIDALAFHKEV